MRAGRPTFFRSARSRDRPAFSRMMIRAICRRSAEMDRMDGSRRSRTYGPRRMPVISIPIIRGSPIFPQRAAMAGPASKINPSDVSIHFPPSDAKKPMAFLQFSNHRSHQLIISGLGFPWENFIPGWYYNLWRYICKCFFTGGRPVAP